MQSKVSQSPSLNPHILIESLATWMIRLKLNIISVGIDFDTICGQYKKEHVTISRAMRQKDRSCNWCFLEYLERASTFQSFK